VSKAPVGSKARITALVLAMVWTWAAATIVFHRISGTDALGALVYAYPFGCSLLGIVPVNFEIFGVGSRRSNQTLPFLSWFWVGLCAVMGFYLLASSRS